MDTSAILNIISQSNSEEEVLWAGKPHKSVLVFESIFNRNLPPTLIFLLFTIVFISQINISFGFVMFLFVYLIPVFIYLLGILATILTYNNTCYVITDKAIYLSTGAFKQIYETRPHTEIKKVTIKKSFFDIFYNIGDITITYNRKGFYTLTRNGIPIHNIPEYNKVYNLLLELKAKAREEIKRQKREEKQKRKAEN